MGRSVEDMDNRTEVRDLLASRRARLSPERAGLTSYDFRRVPGLGRAEVAQTGQGEHSGPAGPRTTSGCTGRGPSTSITRWSAICI